VAAGIVSVDLPVWTSDDRTVPLPAGAPDARLRLPLRDGCVPVAAAGSAASQIEEHVAATWLVTREQEQLGIRAATNPILVEIGKYDERSALLASRPTSLRPLDAGSDRGAAVVEGLLDAHDLIGAHDTQQAQEIATLTEYVVPMDGREFVGGSDLYLFGATFLRLREQWSALCYADHLVHEAAHQLLHAVQELRPLLLNRDQVGQPSPIRSDQRPMYGSFHATFVFLRLTQFMHRVVHAGDPDNQREAEIRLHRHLLGLLQGLQILKDHAVLSDDGQDEVDTWMETARDLVAAVGAPDPRLYRQLTWDYEPPDERLPLVAV
jgi:HEXXH motif-containing protein